MNQLLEQAITERKHIIFEYRNANGERSNPSVEPLAIHYKWYELKIIGPEEYKKDLIETAPKFLSNYDI